MRWLRRRKDLGLGRYVAPDPVDPPSADRVAAEGVAIAESVVRLGMRNRIIVDALRDRTGFNAPELVAWAAAEFTALADREQQAADRLRERADWSPNALWVEDDTEAERRDLQWKEAARRATADAFRGAAADEGRLAELVEQARVDAWHDVSRVIIDRADVSGHREDAGYADERSDRMAQLVAVDLSALAIERGAPLS